MERAEFISTNIGDLVVALREETALYVRDQHEVDKLVAFMLTHLLNNSRAASGTWQYWQ